MGLLFLLTIGCSKDNNSVNPPTPPTALQPTGKGTNADPYLIATLDNLSWLSQHSEAWGLHFKQTQDINVSATSSWYNGAGFSPIGNVTTSFTGSYDGDGYKIDHLTINRPSTDSVGLFGCTSGASLQNIGMTNVNIIGKAYVGGLAGHSEGPISNCYSTGNVTGGAYVGGLVGANGNTITKSYSISSVTGIFSCQCVGGLVGASGNTISSSYSNGSVAAGANSSEVGGLTGDNGGTIMNCYSTSRVAVGANSLYVGGLIGINFGNITYCYSIGSVAAGTNSLYVGGLIGWRYTGTVVANFWNTTTSGQSNSQWGTGVDDTAMKQKATFTGWDFTTIWKITEGVSYPQLQWEP